MKRFISENRFYLRLALMVALSYIFIKLIDNLPFVFNIIDKAYTIITPFIFAFIIAYILNPVVNLFNRKFKIPRGVSITITYILFLGIVVISATFLFPKLYNSLVELINGLPDIAKTIQDLVDKASSDLNNTLNLIPSNLTTQNNHIINTIGSITINLSNFLLSSIISFTGSLINIVLGFLISIYVLVDKNRFIYHSKRFSRIVFGRKIGDHIIEFVGTLNYMIGNYVGIKAIDSCIIASLAFIGLSIISSKYTLLITVIVGVTNMIPYFGPFVGMTTGAIINLFFNPVKALVVFIFLFGLQQFDGWYLDPKLIGNKVGLRPFWVIFGVTVGGALYGPLGMLLGSPVMAVTKIYTLKIMNKFSYRGELKENNDDN